MLEQSTTLNGEVSGLGREVSWFLEFLRAA